MSRTTAFLAGAVAITASVVAAGAGPAALVLIGATVTLGVVLGTVRAIGLRPVGLFLVALADELAKF